MYLGVHDIFDDINLFLISTTSFLFINLGIVKFLIAARIPSILLNQSPKFLILHLTLYISQVVYKPIINYFILRQITLSFQKLIYFRITNAMSVYGIEPIPTNSKN